MSFQLAGTDITLVAAADLSAKQFYAVKVDSAGKAALAGAGENAIGFLQNKPIAGAEATVRIAGVSKCVASGSLAAGLAVAADAAGKVKDAVEAVTNTSDGGGATDPLIGSNVIGVLLEQAGADGNIVACLIQKQGAIPTTAS